MHEYTRASSSNKEQKWRIGPNANVIVCIAKLDRPTLLLVLDGKVRAANTAPPNYNSHLIMWWTAA